MGEVHVCTWLWSEARGVDGVWLAPGFAISVFTYIAPLF